MAKGVSFLLGPTILPAESGSLPLAGYSIPSRESSQDPSVGKGLPSLWLKESPVPRPPPHYPTTPKQHSETLTAV